MDDELPIIIFVLIQSDLADAYSQFALIEDFINANSTLEGEQRFVASLKVCFFF